MIAHEPLSLNYEDYQCMSQGGNGHVLHWHRVKAYHTLSTTTCVQVSKIKFRCQAFIV